MKKFLSTIIAIVLLGATLTAEPAPEVAPAEETAQAVATETASEQVKINEESAVAAKGLHISYEKVPAKVLKGEIFKVQLKLFITAPSLKEIVYSFSNAQGIKQLKKTPEVSNGDNGLFHTFYFVATAGQAKLPDFTASIVAEDGTQYEDSSLDGETLSVAPLPSRADFANIVADTFTITQHKTTSFDDTHNIVVFMADATNCDIASMKLPDVFKQGIESIKESYTKSKITYYAVINKDIKNFSFSYYNLKSGALEQVNMPIVVNDDSVTTQSDISPTSQSNEMLKAIIATIVTIGGFFYIVWKKAYKYLIVLLLPITYIVYAKSPSKQVCVKQDANIYLLPMKNGTVFEKTTTKETIRKDDEVDGWSKVELKNQKIGWIKNEDICKD